MLNIDHFIAGTYKPQYKYKSFSPVLINNDWTWEDPAIDILLEKAHLALGSLDAYSRFIPSPELYVWIQKVKEANTSSKIEGTQTNMDEALMLEGDVKAELRDDWKEVQNYIQAMNEGIQALERLPLSNRLIREVHARLMQGVRGENKCPGEFRTSQNWIGGSNLSDAVFIPPHPGEVEELMSDLEKFWHNEHIQVPHLIKIAVSHYQFETIHPFLDGNGRVGRLLIILYLVGFKLLDKPSLFISAFFEKHRNSYYNALSRVRDANDMTHWIKFFLNGVIDTARRAQETFRTAIALKHNLELQLLGAGDKPAGTGLLLQFIFAKPIFRAADIAQALDITQTTANTLLTRLRNLGIIEEMTGGRRNRLFVFRKYVQVFAD